MEPAEAKTGEPVADVEKQQPLLLPPTAAAETKAPSGDACDCDCEALPRASPTATRTLAFVVLVAGAAFAAQLAAREEYVLLAVFASQLASFCLFTLLLALCALLEDRGRRARWAAGQVLQWSVAMAVTTSMACWVVQSAPVAVGAALLGLALAAVLACHAELVRALWPVQGPR